MEINKLLRIGVDKIKGRQYGNSVLEATLLLGKLLNVDKTYVYTHGKEEVPEDIVDRFMKLIEKRANGYPIQYIMKEKEFMGLDFYIEEGVLIPRPDTEILVEYIIKYIEEKYKDRPVEVVDLGTGSGAIGISIAYYRKNAMVYGVDSMDIPLKVAHINKDKYKLDNVKIIRSDLFQNMNKEQKFDIIASNPPYIPKGDLESLQAEVKDYEPMTALDGGEDGFDFYRRIIPDSKKHLKDQGLLIFEIGYDQGPKLQKMMEEEGFKNIKILKDLQGLDRVVLGRWHKGVE